METIKELDEYCRRIVEVLRKYPQGIGFNKLYEELKDFMSRNTLRRKLDELREEGLIYEDRRGWRRGKSYLIKPSKLSSKFLELLDWMENVKENFEKCSKIVGKEIEKGLIEVEDAINEYAKLLQLALQLIINRELAREREFSEPVEKSILAKTMEICKEIIWEKSLLRTLYGTKGFEVFQKTVREVLNRSSEEFKKLCKKIMERGKLL